MKSLTQVDGRRVAAGDLSVKIAIESERRTPDDLTGATQAWSHVKYAWAYPEPLFVGEREQQGAVRNVTQYRFTLYADATISEQMRIRWDGLTHNIKGIRRGAAREIFMEVIAETGLGD